MSQKNGYIDINMNYQMGENKLETFAQLHNWLNTNVHNSHSISYVKSHFDQTKWCITLQSSNSSNAYKILQRSCKVQYSEDSTK